MSTTQERVILDTDIGTDVDDILALAVILGSPEIKLEGVTTVYGDVHLRARMVAKVFKLRGITSIPVHAGVGIPLLSLDPVFWPGHEGVGLLDDADTHFRPDKLHAVDYLVAHVMRHPGEIVLLAVGPLTNVAMAILREPAFARSLKRLVIMGGRVAIPAGTSHPAEHNIKCDPEAAHVVFSSDAPIELVPLDVTLQAMIRQDGVDLLKSRHTPYHDALANQVALYPGFTGRGGSTFLHDPLAALAVVRPGLLTWESYQLSVELTGKFTRGMIVSSPTDATSPRSVSVAMNLDVAACESMILDRISS